MVAGIDQDPRQAAQDRVADGPGPMDGCEVRVRALGWLERRAVAMAFSVRPSDSQADVLMKAADLVASTGADQTALACTWLYGCVESGATTLESVCLYCGYEVASLLEWIRPRYTDAFCISPSEGSDSMLRARRLESDRLVALERARVAVSPPEAKTVRLAMIVAAAETIASLRGDNSRADVRTGLLEFFRSAQLHLLPVLTGGDMRLWYRAKSAVEAL